MLLSSVGTVSATEISLEYFFTRKEMRILAKIPSRGKMYDRKLDILDPEPDDTAAPARLPIDVFCKIMGRQPIAVGSRKSRKNLTLVAAKA